MSSDKDAEIVRLIEQLQGKREKQDELKKKGGWGSWLKVIGIAIAILIGVGVVKYLLNRRNAELAKLKTKEEKAAVAMQNTLHEAEQEERADYRQIVMDHLEKENQEQKAREARIEKSIQDAKVQAIKLKQVQSWSEINKA
jgi:hypothetical protein